VEDYINNISDQRNIPVDKFDDLKNMMMGTINNMSEEQKTIWAQKQTYIGLGFSLVASAVEGVDSTPMEGFIPEQVDEVLGLDELGLKSTLVLPLGYRDEGDYLSSMKKIRRDDDSFFIRR
jgi:nitroreductase